MNRDDEYRRNATFAQLQAEATANAADKAAWLRLAANWLGMIPKSAQQQQSHAFDAEVKEHGTGQKGSDSSH